MQAELIHKAELFFLMLASKWTEEAATDCERVENGYDCVVK